MKKTLCFVMILLFGFAFQALADEPIGMFVNSNTNSFQFINPLTQAVSPSMQKGNIGSYGGGLFDVAITSDGKTAIVSNFGDSKIFFFDISGGFAVVPPIIGEAYIPFFAEDIVITPDDMWVLVTDGGFSSRVAAVNIATGAIVNNNTKNQYANAVAITPDGKTIVTADYFNGQVHSYTFDNTTGMITHKDTAYILPVRPVNVSISPDGKTILVANAAGYYTAVLTFYGDSKLHINGNISMPTKNGQSCIFSKDGTKAYYLSNSYLGGTNIIVLNVTAPGIMAVSATIPLSIPRGTSQLFGVDTIAIDPSGNYLYVTNPTLSGGVVEVTVIDLTTNTEVNQLHGNGIPTGIAFGTIMAD